MRDRFSLLYVRYRSQSGSNSNCLPSSSSQKSSSLSNNNVNNNNNKSIIHTRHGRSSIASSASRWNNGVFSTITLQRLLLLMILLLIVLLYVFGMISVSRPSSIVYESQSNNYYPPYSTKTNAIIYLAQKSHKVYQRDSFANLQQSLDRLFEHYLLINQHYQNVTVFIFHTGDFTNDDLQLWEQSRYPQETRGTIQLINLNNTPYWQTPSHIQEQDLSTWHNPNFNLGYRHMIRWYALRVWDYFQEINTNLGTNYRYIMRMDEESFIHTPIRYDLFQFMSKGQYYYAYRMCSYEMASLQKILHNFTAFARQSISPTWNKISHFNGGYCGFYNNWFIGDLTFFLSKDVQFFFRWIDVNGYMYRDRLNDLVIQTGAVYSFCPKHRIHRFLDWTYEHFTLNSTTGCPIWGGLSTGYNDVDAGKRIETYVEDFRRIGCVVEEFPQRLRHVPKLHTSQDHVRDLSPNFQHLPIALQNATLLSLKAGRIDLPGRGDKSG